MTVFPYQINEVVQVYNRVSKLKASTLLEKEQGSETQDIVNLSAEGKKKQVLSQTKNEVLARIRDPK